MGAFFTNVQVRTSDVDAVARALREDAAARGMDLAPEGVAADRSVLVLPPENGWIAVYDQATESQHPDPLADLALLLSRVAASHAISIAVHDSDILDLRLYERGRRVDRLDSDPSYYGSQRVSAKKRAALAGAAERWRGVVPDDDLEALSRAFGADDLFAEATLARVVELAGIDPRRASLGYRYALEDELPPETVTLRFRLQKRPAWETPREGPPVLTLGSYPHREIQFSVGDELRVPFGTLNTGGAAQGLAVRTWGSALKTGLVEVDRFELVIGKPRPGAVTTVPATTARTSDGETLRVADLPELALPGGTATHVGFTPGMDVHALIDAQFRANVHVNVVGRVTAPGRGTLGIGLVPLAHPEGAAGYEAKLVLDAAFERPLRAYGPTTSSHTLRGIEGQARLVAGVAMRSREEAAALARAWVDAMRARWADDASVSTTVFLDGLKPKVGKGKAKTMLRGKRWDDWVAAIASAPLVELTVGPLHVSVGVGLAARRRSEPRAPWLTVSYDSTQDDVAAQREAWSARIDEALREGRALQALIDRRDEPVRVDQDAYEVVCGLRYGTGTLRAWNERWLRVPSRDRTWIDASLTARLDRGALAALAEIEEIGTGWRFTLRDRARWRAAEDVLAPILASLDDAR